MRFMIDIYPDQTPDIIELDHFSAVSGGRDGQITDLFIFTREAGEERGEYFGQYNTDGTPEGYRKALENYKAAAAQMLEKGFLRASQLEDFEIW